MTTEPCCVERLITCRVALNAPIGPKSTRLSQTLEARFVSSTRLVIETKSQAHDAPYSDAFLVNSLIVVDEQKNGTCLLRVWWGVRFLKVSDIVRVELSDNQKTKSSIFLSSEPLDGERFD